VTTFFHLHYWIEGEDPRKPGGEEHVLCRHEHTKAIDPIREEDWPRLSETATELALKTIVAIRWLPELVDELEALKREQQEEMEGGPDDFTRGGSGAEASGARSMTPTSAGSTDAPWSDPRGFHVKIEIHNMDAADLDAAERRVFEIADWLVEQDGMHWVTASVEEAREQRSMMMTEGGGPRAMGDPDGG
jgi:hypothetical protein